MLTDVDREHLDREYNARAMTAAFDKDAIYRERSAEVFETVERVADIVYDGRSGSKLDIYPAGKGSPLFLWIHGGYWRASTKDENAFVAPGLVQAGISVASIDYTLAPAASLDEIVRQVRAGVAWLERHGGEYGADTRLLHVGGHSAGGHLTGMLLARGWHDGFGLRTDLIGTALPVSGLFDLHPLRHTFVNGPLSLDEAAASRNSPIEHLPERSGADLIAAVGGLESSEFKRQTRDYVDRWAGRSFRGREIAMPGFHHFDIILELAGPGNPLFDALHASVKAW